MDVSTLVSVKMDVSTLVSQMHDTLSTIHSTLASLDTTSHDARLDELERQRDSTLSTLRITFSQQAEAFAQKRKAELDEIAERRKREDEERERHRRLEDAQLSEHNREEDQERRLQLEKKTQDVEEETDGLMYEIEEDATRLLEEGKERLRVLEQRRREINRLIDEQLKAPLPSAPSRRKTMRSVNSTLPPVVATESKMPVPNIADEQPGNPGVKAPSEDDGPDGHKPHRVHQASESLGLSRSSSGPEPRRYSSTRSESCDEELSSHGALATVDLTETDAETMHQNHLIAGEATESLNLDTLEIPQDGSEPISLTEDVCPQAPESACSDDQFAMTGHEAIPGTMTHGSDDSRSEIIEPIPGTMTHGVDHVYTEGEDSGEDATPVVEKLATESVSNSTELERPLETRMREDAAMNNAAKLYEDGSVSADHDSDDCRDQTEIEEHTVQVPSLQVLSTTPDNQAVQNGSKLDQPQFGTVQHGLSIKQDSSKPLLESLSAEGIPAEEELPAVIETVTMNMLPTENTDAQAQELSLSLSLTKESRQTNDENDRQQHSDSLRYQGADVDVSSGEGSWSEGDSQDASYSQNESIEVDLAANTSIGSVLPASTETSSAKDGIYLDDSADSSLNTSEAISNFDNFEDISRVVNLEEANSSCTTIPTPSSADDKSQATAKAEVPREEATDDHKIDDIGPIHADDADKPEGILSKTMEAELLPRRNSISQGDDPSLEAHRFPITEGDSSALNQNNDDDYDPEASQDLHDSRFREKYMQPVRDDGDPANHYEHEEEYDPKVHVSDSPFRSPKHTSQLGWNEGDSGFVLGHGNLDAESQSSMTPLASADFHTPMQFQEWNDSQGYETAHLDSVDSQYGLEDQQATTVRGQDDLFNDDDHIEDGSTESASNSGLERNDEDGHQDRSATPIHEHFAERTPNVYDREPEAAILEDTEAEGSYIPQISNNTAGSDPDHQVNKPSKISEIAAIGPSLKDLSSVAADPGDADTKITPRLGPQNPPVTPGMTTLSLRPDMTPIPSKGLASSRHNPARPHTPQQQSDQSFGTEHMGSETFAPVDVTNIPWHARRDSTPRSLHSQSTLSSSPSSPIHSSLPVDNHEPVIRDSWPPSTHDRLLLSGMGRSRNDSQVSSSGDFEPFRYDPKAVAAQWQQREIAEHHGPSSNGRTTPHRNSIASSSPGGLFQKMRSIFEPAGGASANRSLPSSGRNSPVWTRAANGAPHSSSRNTSGVAPSPTRPAGGIVTRDGDGYDSASERRGGSLFTEAVAGDEADERSSLLNNSYEEGMEVN